MRTTFVNSAILLLGAAMLLVQDSALARGPGGGVQTLATPSFGGGGSRGGSIGSSGLSFGSGGISFGGGGGRVSIGTGAGGISFGTRGRTATPSFNRGRTEVPDYRGNRGSVHVVPQVHIVPQYQLPNPTPTRVPQPTFQPPVVQSVTPQIQPNELPTNPAPEPIATDPQPNSGELAGRQITEAEVQRAREFFQQRLLDLAKVLEKRLPPAEYDPEQLAALMVQHSIPVEIQIQIVDALNRGEYDQAREIWVTIVPRVEIPFKPSRIRVLFLKFYVMIERGYISYPLVQEIFYYLPPEAQRPSTCCGADDLLVQIQEVVRINEAIAGVPAETPTDYSKPESFSKPQSNDRPYTYASTEVQTGQFAGKPDSFGKPGGVGETQPYGKPGQPVPIPSGPVNIVYHPKLPDRQVVVVNAQTVMVGTGGRGAFRMEHGYVAEALGHRIGHGTPMADNQSDLVRSGVVVVNATQAKVGFVFGSHQVTLEPGYQQVLNGKGEISFDRGAGKGTARYTLESGTYEFEVGADGWDLHSKSYEVTVSNEGNLEPFNYIAQGQQVSLAPEETTTHTASYPILIRFDRGDGSAVKQIRWEKSQGTLQIAINPTDNLWDFFVFDEMEAEEQKSILQPTPDFVPAF